MSKIDIDSILSQLSQKSGHLFPPEYHQKIKARLSQELNYTPRIAIFGKTGAGKSSLLNALFGKVLSPVSNVEACTRTAIEHNIQTGRGAITLIDCPGVGESQTRDQEYYNLYLKLLEGSGDQGVDMILWVLKGDDRAFTSDLDFYNKVVKPAMNQNLPILFVLNQIDKVEPYREWDMSLNKPGNEQATNIMAKQNYVSSCFSIPTSLIIPVSASTGYQIGNLMYEMVTNLKTDRVKVSISRVMNPEHKSEKVNQESKESFMNILGQVIEFVVPSVSKIWKGIKSIFS